MLQLLLHQPINKFWLFTKQVMKKELHFVIVKVHTNTKQRSSSNEYFTQK